MTHTGLQYILQTSWSVHLVYTTTTLPYIESLLHFGLGSIWMLYTALRKKGAETVVLVLYMATPGHTTESVNIIYGPLQVPDIDYIVNILSVSEWVSHTLPL